MEATITSKGQVTLPKAFRDKHDLKPGEKLVFIEEADGSTRIVVRRNNLDALVGLLKPRKNKSQSLEDLSKATEEGAMESYRKSIQ